MRIFHTEKGIDLPKPLAVEPLGTIMIFGQSELRLVGEIVQGFIEMMDEKRDAEALHQLLDIQRYLMANTPEVLN